VVCRLYENFELLKERYLKIQESKSALEVDLNRKSHHNRMLISEMNALKPEIKRLLRQRDSLKEWLRIHGKTHDYLDSILERKEDRSVQETWQIGTLPSWNRPQVSVVSVIQNESL
jgi:hypothetical protein